MSVESTTIRVIPWDGLDSLSRGCAAEKFPIIKAITSLRNSEVECQEVRTGLSPFLYRPDFISIDSTTTTTVTATEVTATEAISKTIAAKINRGTIRDEGIKQTVYSIIV